MEQKPVQRQIPSRHEKEYFQEMRRWAFPRFVDHLAAELRDCESILDLGCGSDSPVAYVSASCKVGVDMHEPSLFESKKKGIHSENICANITQIEFKSNSFDAVVMKDVLEHLSKQEGIELIEKAEQWAKKKVIIAGPNGFIPQDAYDNNPHQRHVSGWTVEDFESMGFAVSGFHGLRFLRGELHQIRFRPKSFFSRLSDASELVTFSHPALAATLFCKKNLRTVHSNERY